MESERLVKSFNLADMQIGDSYDKIVLYQQNLGDYGIDWLMCYKNGVLVARYNTRYVESIHFV